jgi:predicted ribosome quality control (RQC) complex YloA/Tae2 family protein
MVWGYKPIYKVRMPQDIPCKPYFDSILLFCLLRECKDLEGKKVKAIKRDGKYTMVLCFDENALLISTNPVLYRAHLDSGHLRKDLIQHPFESQVKFLRIAEVKQLGFDRIFSLGFSKSGIHPSCYLVCELTGPSSNVFLINEQSTIIASHRAAKTRKKGGRYQMGGKTFDELIRLSAEGILTDIVAEEHLKDALQHKLKKVPPWLSALIPGMEDEQLRNRLKTVLKEPKPHIHYEGSKPCFTSPLKISSQSKPSASFSTAIAELYEYFLQENARDRLKRQMQRKLKDSRKIQKKLALDQKEADLSGEYKKKGELILLHIKEIRKGTKILTVPDPYDEKHTVEIELDPAKTAARNAADYFRKARKSLRSKETVKRRTADINNEIDRLTKLVDSIDTIPTETIQQMVESSEKIEHRRKQEASRPFREFKTRSGRKILVGRSRSENEHLTFHIAKANDLFFHVREAPGSHTILVNDGAITQADIQEAAAAAAHFSKAKHSSIVPVSYTQRRYVRKSKKLGAGKVIVSRETTVFVEPTLPSGKS